MRRSPCTSDVPLIGLRFGKRIIIALAPPGNKGKTQVLTRCDCGREAVKALAALRAGQVTACKKCADMIHPCRPFSERFWSKVTKTDSCWLWTGSLSKNGYGSLGEGRRGGKSVSAHRYSYELHKGLIPEGYQIDHLCRVRNCVNPDHMEAVTPQENTLRGESPSATVCRTGLCRNGHPMDESNTYVNPSSGHRRCRTCLAAWRKKQKEKSATRAAGDP